MDVEHAADLLDPEAIARADALGLHARYVVEGYMAGEHKSPYRGFAVEFAQHREYAPGDDTRDGPRCARHILAGQHHLRSA